MPAYRTGVSPLLRGVEIGLTHGFFITGPFIKLGPLRSTDVAEVVGSLSGAGLVVILTACLTIYGAVSFQQPEVVGVKTLTGRSVARDPLQTSEGWAQFSSGWLVGGLSGVAFACALCIDSRRARSTDVCRYRISHAPLPPRFRHPHPGAAVLFVNGRAEIRFEQLRLDWLWL